MEAYMKYSEAFKQQVVRELDEGKFVTMKEASRAYGIKGAETVRKWVTRYGKGSFLGKVVRVETPDEIDERQVLKKEVKKLKGAVSDLHLDMKLESAFLQLACERLGMSVEAFKKKYGAEQ